MHEAPTGPRERGTLTGACQSSAFRRSGHVQDSPERVSSPSCIRPGNSRASNRPTNPPQRPKSFFLLTRTSRTLPVLTELKPYLPNQNAPPSGPTGGTPKKRPVKYNNGRRRHRSPPLNFQSTYNHTLPADRSNTPANCPAPPGNKT